MREVAIAGIEYMREAPCLLCIPTGHLLLRLCHPRNTASKSCLDKTYHESFFVLTGRHTLMVLSREALAKVLVSLGLNKTCTNLASLVQMRKSQN